MSFIKKAVKKVFKGIKKIVKSKVFKWIAIAALVFFTAGVAAGGFAAFTGVNGIGAFFTAVGQTMATGAASIASSLGFQGVSSSLASHGGAAAIQAGLTTQATSATGLALSANAASGTISATAGGANAAVGQLANRAGEAVLLSAKGTAAANAAAQAALAQNVGNVVSSVPGLTAAGNVTGTALEGVMGGLVQAAPAGMSSGTKTVLLSGLMTGATSILQARRADNQRKGPTFVAGDLSHGGGTEVSTPKISVGTQDARPITGDTAPPVSIAEQEPTTAGLLARAEGPPMEHQSLYDATQPTELPAGEEVPTRIFQDESAMPDTQEGLGLLANLESPTFQNTNSFFSKLPQATPIKEEPRRNSFEDRVFGGNIAGVA